MLTLELRFMLDGREVAAERLAGIIGAEISKAIRAELRQPQFAESARPEPPRAPRFEKRAFSPKEAAKLLGVSEAGIRRHITLGTIPYFRFGRLVMISSETIEKILRKGVPSERQIK